MSLRGFPLLAWLTLTPSVTQAHDAFGDLGPFYRNLLHPLADPAQGLLLGAIVLILVRQPRSAVQVAYLSVAAAALLAALLQFVTEWPSLATRPVGGIVVCLGLVAVLGVRLPMIVTVVLSATVALMAGFMADGDSDGRGGILTVTGSVAGISVFILLGWALLDMAMTRWGTLVTTVAGSWVTAIGMMAAALPTATA